MSVSEENVQQVVIKAGTLAGIVAEVLQSTKEGFVVKTKYGVNHFHRDEVSVVEANPEEIDLK